MHENVNESEKLDRKKQIVFYLPLIVFLAFLVGWSLASILVMRPLIEEVPTDKISDLAGSMIQASGILVGFTGLSVFFFLGKTEELLSSTSSRVANVVQSWSKVEIQYNRFHRQIKQAEAEILLAQKDLKKSAAKKIEKLKKAIQKVKNFAKEEKEKNSKLETEINEQSERMMKAIGQSIQVLSVSSIISILLFVGALVLSFLLELTGRLRFLEGAIDFIVIGIGFLAVNWLFQQQYANKMREIFYRYARLNSHIVAGQFTAQDMKEEFELFFTVEKAKLDIKG